MNVILWIILGGLAGWIADIIMESNHGVLIDIIFGIIGGFIGGIIMQLLQQTGATGFELYSLLVSIIGAVILIGIGRIFYKGSG